MLTFCRLNQLPYLDNKTEYRWGVRTVADVVSWFLATSECADRGSIRWTRKWT